MRSSTSDVGELDLHFLGGLRDLASFQNVLFSGSRGLDHLIDGAVAAGEILVREAEGDVIDDLGFLVGEKGAVVAERRQDALGFRF
jgi:hypothetical protein